MTADEADDFRCWFGLYIFPDRAFLPTCIQTDFGDFDVEPIKQVDYRNRQELADAIEDAIAVGNPFGEAPSRDNRQKPTPMEVLTDAKSWIDLEKKSIYVSISIFSSEFLIQSSKRKSDGTWSGKQDALKIKISKDAGTLGVADAILEHLRQRTDLPGLAL